MSALGGGTMRVRLLWVAALICCLTFLLQAQSERGTITGAVRDSSGAVVPGATVTVTSTATNAVSNLVTNDSGEYTAPSLAAGTYTVRVEKPGFRPSEETGLVVSAATTVRADITMTIGQSQQVVEVQASAL